VHYATRNGDAFSALAQEMVDAGQDSVDPEAWARAKDMGRELAAENPLFAKSETDGAFDAEDVTALAAADDDTLSLDDLELSELTAAYDEPEGLANDLEAPSEVSITLDLEDTSELAAVPELALPEAISMDELGSMDFELPEVEKGVEPAGQAQADDLSPDSLDLDTMMAEAEAAVDQDDSLINLDSGFSADELQAQLDELSDLSAFDSDLDASAEVRAVDAPSILGLVAEDRGVSPDGLDQPLNLDRVFDTAEDGDELSELIGLDQPQGLDEPAGEDEVATKLDLARAYVDMGDDDGARSILEEVVVEGNDGQRGDAEQLLQRLG
jgi:pilus assembly protein FimV